MIIGHTAILDFFATARESGHLAHAYIFAGPDQVGKRTVARHIGAELLGVNEEKLATHPDFVRLERLTDEKSGKLKKEITVAQARDLRTRLQRSSWLGGYQIVVINEAELLNVESANALLKLLEEPGSKTIFFLITENERALLPTIRSRAAVLFFSAVPEIAIRTALEQRGAADAAAIAELAGGRPGRALAFAEDPELLAWYKTETVRFRSLIGQPFHVKAKTLETLFGKDDSDTAPQNPAETLRVWLQTLRQMVHENPRPALITALSGLMEAEQQISKNTNPRLLLETILIDV